MITEAMSGKSISLLGITVDSQYLYFFVLSAILIAIYIYILLLFFFAETGIVIDV
jgi:hypothetical protein